MHTFFRGLAFLIPFFVQAAQVDIPGPAGSSYFGNGVYVLPNGNIVVRDTFYSIPGGAAEVGAVYLFSPAGVLISTLTGSTADDHVGSEGITILANGNYVVRSPEWNNGAATDAGAVTWASATMGVSGVVSASNSLIGSSSNDYVGDRINQFDGVIPLSNGNYLVRTPDWDNGAARDAGAVTWGSGSTGVSGVISATLSLVGSSTDDEVGYEDITLLSNGNYVVPAPAWNNGANMDAGAVTWGSGVAGVAGLISATNSLIGGTANDMLAGGGVGGGEVVALSNGDYVVCSPVCDNPNSTVSYALYAGAVTWCSGITGRVGVVSVANSLMGNRPNDYVGRGGVKELGGGRFVVISYNVDNTGVIDAGAVTWCENGAAAVGIVSPANSLFGTNTDLIGSGGVTVLTNGNYVVSSPYWDNGSVLDAGAVTWVDGTAGLVGAVTASNSLVGSTAFDEVGEVTALSNGNYVVNSLDWDDGATVNVGAVTWGDGTTGTVGLVSTTNSLVGSQAGDKVGTVVSALPNGNYVARSYSWKNGAAASAGAVTWCNGSGATVAVVSPSNSLVGSTANDAFGTGFIALSNGNYVVSSPGWDNGSIEDAGAATWGSGTSGVSGVISAANSLVGSKIWDHVGQTLLSLSNGNYVVVSPSWSKEQQFATANDAGAFTWGSGTTGIKGVVSETNSLVGDNAVDGAGASVVELKDGNYLVLSPYWDNAESETEPAQTDVGSATWCSGSVGRTGKISSSNSLVGNTELRLGREGATANSDGSYIMQTGKYYPVPSTNSAAVSLCAAGGGTVGAITAANSVIETLEMLMPFDYDPARRQLVVGRYRSNKVSLLRAAVPPPTVAMSTTSLPADSSSMVITGTNFSTLPNDNVVTFSGGASGVVTAATTTQLTVTSLSGFTAGPLTAVVTSGGVSSGAAVRVGTITPVILTSTSNLGAGASSIILNGFGFSATPGSNVVTFSGGVTGVVTAATKTQLTVSLSGLIAGSLNASVTVNGTSSGASVSVASVIPVITPRTTNMGLNTTSLILQGFGFSPSPANNSVAFSNGVTGVVTAATTTQLTVTGLTGLTEGALTVVVTTGGISSGGPVQVATIVPPASGTIAFGSAVYSVNQGAISVQLTIVRAGSDTATGVTINTDNGTTSIIPPFSAAVAGVDYTDLGGAAATVDFALGELSRTVNITLFAKTGSTIPNKRFTATLSNPVGGAEIGITSITTIQILASDTTKPTLTITAPAAGSVSAALPYVVAGVAGDARGIDRVEVVLNGVGPMNAVLGNATSTTSVPYSLPITPLEGPNTLTVTAYDLRGNFTALTRNFTFTRRRLLTLARSVPVSLAATPDAAGTVVMAATPSASASALIPTAANTNPKTSAILPGTSVKLTATPKTGYVFSHWSGTPGGAVDQGNVITFNMPAADLPITATFMLTPFSGPAGSSNGFYGLIHPTGGAFSSNVTEGFLSGTLTPATGAFTGKVFIDGLAQSFNATFFGNGSGFFTVGTTKQSTLSFGGKTLTLSYNAGNVIANVVNGAYTSTGTASRGIYSSTGKVPLIGTVKKGTYTVVFPSKTQTPPLLRSTYPQGDGYGTLTLTDVGVVTLAGTLSDGSALTASSVIVAGGQSPLFAQLITPGAAATVKGGSFGGVLTFDSSQPNTDASGADLLWIRPAVTQVTGTTAAALAKQLYTDGWPGGIRVDAVGALYNSTVKVQAALGLGAVDTINGNGKLVLSGGRLTGDVSVTVFNINGSTVTKIPTTNATFTLTVTQSSGAFSGTFTPNWANPATTKPAFKGILLQKGANIGGYGFFISNALNDLDPESGGVTLGAP
jgi:hypothetical protein